MYRKRFVKSFSFSLLLITCIYAVSAACFESVTGPCYSAVVGNTATGRLDTGVWRVTTINGQPAQNFPLPLPSTDDFYAGSLDFRTLDVTGACDDPAYTSGSVSALYTLKNSSGQFKPTKTYLAIFEYNHRTHTVTITAGGGEYEVRGTVSGTTMTLPAAHQIFGSYTLVLQQ
jgi:hypothetical protein